MNPTYDDIRSAIDRDPDWFEDNGVPRYAPFEPTMLGPYGRFAVLSEVQCQACDFTFRLGQVWQDSGWSVDRSTHVTYLLEELIVDTAPGDPPRHDCPHGGESMLSVPLRVIEAWERPTGPGNVAMDWLRRSDLE